MAKITAEEAVEFPVLPDDSILHLKVESTRIIEVDGRNGTWEKLEFTFKILGIQVTGDGSDPSQYANLIGENIWGSVPFRLNDGAENKLRIWAEAILNMDVGVGFELDTDYFLRRDVRGITDSYEKKKGGVDPRTGKPFRQHQVMTLLRAGQTVSQPGQQGGWGNQTAAAPAAQQNFQFDPVPPANGQVPTPVQDPWATSAPTQQPPAPAPQPQPVPWGGQPFTDDPPF